MANSSTEATVDCSAIGLGSTGAQRKGLACLKTATESLGVSTPLSFPVDEST